MQITKPAQTKLRRLLPDGWTGFRYNGFIGTCTGSTPLIKPVKEPWKGVRVEAAGIVFFASPRDALVLDAATLDYDSRFFGKGLTMTWPHGTEGCGCSCH